MRHFKHDAWLETADAAEVKAMRAGNAMLQSRKDNQHGIRGPENRVTGWFANAKELTTGYQCISVKQLTV